MTTEKLLYVSCQIPQSRAWELLRLLEAAKAGNVEVRPVVPIAGAGPPVLDGKFFSKRKKTGLRKGSGVSEAVGQVMILKENRRPHEIAMEIGANPKSVYSALSLGVKRGVYKKTDEGFMRVKEDE
jgi:hypothetical protein